MIRAALGGPSPRTLYGERSSIGGFGGADIAMAVFQLNVARQIAEEELKQLVVGILRTHGEQVLLGSGPRGEARSSCGRKGSLFRAVGSQQYLRRKTAHNRRRGFPHFWTI